MHKTDTRRPATTKEPAMTAADTFHAMSEKLSAAFDAYDAACQQVSDAIGTHNREALDAANTALETAVADLRTALDNVDSARASMHAAA